MRLGAYDPPKGTFAAVRHPEGGLVVFTWWKDKLHRHGYGHGVVNGMMDPEADCDWQPLLTAEEWQAQHPLRLRKLGEGEKLKEFSLYVWGNKQIGYRLATGNCLSGDLYDYYELLGLTAAQSEPTIADKVTQRLEEHIAESGGMTPEEREAQRQSFAYGNCNIDNPDVTREVVAKAAQPNPVGERLTSPAVGEWIVCFRDGFSPYVYRWDRSDDTSKQWRYYRWHGPIPEEPQPEKPEPPKWLNRESIIGKANPIADEEGFFVIATYVKAESNERRIAIVGQHYRTPSCLWIDADKAILITDDPDYPPSPELAALFGENEVGQ